MAQEKEHKRRVRYSGTHPRKYSEKYKKDIYFEDKCDQQTRIKIYCYISMCGLLWSNWCEYKYTLGVEFGEYSLAQYRFAKDYYNIVIEEMGNMK